MAHDANGPIKVILKRDENEILVVAPNKRYPRYTDRQERTQQIIVNMYTNKQHTFLAR